MALTSCAQHHTWLPACSSGPYLSLMLATNNEDTTGQHLRLSHFLKNMAAYTAKYNLHDAVELIIVDYNSNPALPPLWEAPSLVLPDLKDLPLVRFITVTHSMHKVRWEQRRSYCCSAAALLRCCWA
jgi:hypothetical protein